MQQTRKKQPPQSIYLFNIIIFEICYESLKEKVHNITYWKRDYPVCVALYTRVRQPQPQIPTINCSVNIYIYYKRKNIHTHTKGILRLKLTEGWRLYSIFQCFVVVVAFFASCISMLVLFAERALYVCTCVGYTEKLVSFVLYNFVHASNVCNITTSIVIIREAIIMLFFHFRTNITNSSIRTYFGFLLSALLFECYTIFFSKKANW